MTNMTYQELGGLAEHYCTHIAAVEDFLHNHTTIEVGPLRIYPDSAAYTALKARAEDELKTTRFNLNHVGDQLIKLTGE